MTDELKEDDNKKADVFDLIINRAQQLAHDNTEHKTTPAMRATKLKTEKQVYKEYQEWERKKLETRNKTYPILCYCDDIRGVVHAYEITFEEYKKTSEASEKYREKLMNEKGQNRKQPMKNMTKAEQKEERKKRRLVREQHKQDKLDQNLEAYRTPSYLLYKVIDEINCECEAEKIRAGEYCDTCKLLVKVNEYMLDLFKRESQGRGTIL